MFFSVKSPIKIGGKSYKTCICYELTEMLERTVNDLVKAGKAEIYNEQRFFCNGKLVEIKKPAKKSKRESKKAVEDSTVIEGF